ncbi:MAG TPA: hypothetical protein VHW96_15675 [Solirubrobacteraceae bacterium]|jgi:hypothetical protein|nr:hypothetical protein [Solirubrobacteraceae bacterium]
MSVTTPTLKLLGFVVPPPAALEVPAALDEVAAGALDEVEPPLPPAALELDELLLPHAASDKAATIPTVHIPR